MRRSPSPANLSKPNAATTSREYHSTDISGAALEGDPCQIACRWWMNSTPAQRRGHRIPLSMPQPCLPAGRLQAGVVSEPGRLEPLMLTALLNARVLTPDEELAGGTVVVRDGRIEAVGGGLGPPPRARPSAPPTPEAPEEIRSYARWVVSRGVTGFLVTLVGAPLPQMKRWLAAAAAAGDGAGGGARPPGGP